MATTRLSGLATGLDTESIIKQLMDVERAPINKLEQKKLKTEWTLDAYRNVTTSLRTFKSTYMDTLNQATNMLSKTNYKIFKAKVNDYVTGAESNAVKITTNSDTLPGIHTIQITKLATSAVAKSTDKVTANIQSSGEIDNLNLAGKKLTISLDGTAKTISLNNYDTMENMISDINDKLKSTFGTGFDGNNSKIVVSETAEGSNKIQFSAQNGANVMELKTSDNNDALAGLKLQAGTKNRLTTDMKLGDLKTKFKTELTFGGTNEDELKFSINGANFTFDTDTKLSEMIREVNNNEKANVVMKYDEVNDVFIIQSKTTGTGTNISIKQTAGNFFGAVANINSSDFSNGEDAVVNIDGEDIVRNTNSFSVNNVRYNLNAVTTNKLDINLSVDSDAVYEKVKTFVEKYNELIESLNKTIGEEYDRNYQPLTKAQKEAMSDDDIKKWETKAKTGLLRNDSMIKTMLSKMRNAVIESVEGVTGTLAAIGIKSTRYQDKGKLTIDESALKQAVENDPDKVANLFAKQSEDYPTYNRSMKEGQRKIRYEQQGIVARIYDVIEDNISTFRDTNGKKGLLVEKAGVVGDTSDFTNMLAKQIIDYDNRIDNWEDKLAAKETAYYRKYAALEKGIQNMNARSSSLVSMLGNNSN